MRHGYWTWKQYLSMENIKNINSTVMNNFTPVIDQPAKSKKTSNVKFIEYKKIKPYLNNCLDSVFVSNENNFNSNVFSFDDTCNVLHNTYNKGSEYNWHIDGNGFSDDWEYKFTILINLSEKKYKGGKFKLWNTGKPVHIKELDDPGDMIMFRSFFLHKVTPITYGTRQTLTIFIKGPSF